MASSVLGSFKIGISYQIGVNSAGKDVFKGQSFTDVGTSITDDLVVGFVDKVNSLLMDEYSVSSIKKELVYTVTRG